MSQTLRKGEFGGKRVKLVLVEETREGVYRFFAHGRGNTHTHIHSGQVKFRYSC